MNENLITKAYEMAKERYAAIGVDTDKAIELLEKTPISLQCWQADDVMGFENDTALTGGIQATGNYPGRARNIDELRADIKFVKSLLAGTQRLNLHEIYGDFQGKHVDRDEVEPAHFQSWMEWGKENGMKLDFNSTSFSHPKSGDLSLANPDKSIRDFWIEHTKRCRRVADAMGKFQDDPCIMNIWVHDGSKDQTVNRLRYREIMAQSLDEILAEKLPGMKTCLEAKLFGIGLESYTVGSHDFVTGYCSTRKLMYTLDTGHYEQTENISDMVASLLLYVPELMLHTSRPVRWDSDHVVTMNDQITSYSTNACFLRDADALMLENLAYKMIKARQTTTEDGSWLLRSDIGARRMGVEAHRVMMSYLMHLAASTADMQPTDFETFRARHSEAKHIKEQNIVRAYTKDRFTTFSWAPGISSYTGYIAANSVDKNKIVVPFKQNNTGNFLGFYTVSGKGTNIKS